MKMLKTNRRQPFSPLSLRQRLKAGEALFGGWVQIPALASAEILAAAGFDWIAIDCEHGLIDLPIAATMLSALRAKNVPGLLRLPACDSIWIRRALDAGAAGLIIPMVNSTATAQEMVRWAKYPPEGERGFGFSRANLYGQDFDTYCATANKQTVLIAQIEHIQAVHEINNIAAVKGIDAFFIGPYDLAGSMGLVGQPHHPKVLKACQYIKKAAAAKKIPVGIHVVSSDPKVALRYLRSGFQLIALGIDTLFIRDAATRLLQAIKPTKL